MLITMEIKLSLMLTSTLAVLEPTALSLVARRT